MDWQGLFKSLSPVPCYHRQPCHIIPLINPLTCQWDAANAGENTAAVQQSTEKPTACLQWNIQLKSYRVLIGNEQKCWFNSSLTPKFSGRCERAACEYLMQESHIPPSHMKKVYEKWVLVAAPGWILNHQDWPSVSIYTSLEAYSRWHLNRLPAGFTKANPEGRIDPVFNSYFVLDIRDIHLWPVEFWENHTFSPETWKFLFSLCVRHLFLSCSFSRAYK